MDDKKLELVGMIVLPKFAGFMSGAEAFKKAEITTSRLFNELFLEHVVTNLPEKTVACHRIIVNVEHDDLLDLLGPKFCPLEAADIWRLLQLQEIDSKVKFNDDGAYNHVFIADMLDKTIADTIWWAQVFNCRPGGWRAELYRQRKIVCQELFFSGYA